MPMYEYQCEQCFETTEAIQKFNKSPLIDCPSCEAPSLKKLVSAPSFRLKGGGWYETDFKSRSKKNLATSDNQGPTKDSQASAATQH